MIPTLEQCEKAVLRCIRCKYAIVESDNVKCELSPSIFDCPQDELREVK